MGPFTVTFLSTFLYKKYYSPEWSFDHQRCVYYFSAKYDIRKQGYISGKPQNIKRVRHCQGRAAKMLENMCKQRNIPEDLFWEDDVERYSFLTWNTFCSKVMVFLYRRFIILKKNIWTNKFEISATFFMSGSSSIPKNNTNFSLIICCSILFINH